jgi:hypothetical protein
VDRAAWEAAGGLTVAGVAKKGTGEAVVEDPTACMAGVPVIPLRLRLPDHDHAGEGSELGLPLPPLVVSKTNAAFDPGVDCQELDGTLLGVAPLGSGQITLFGAILPDPTEEANHPYGLDDHAVAANGNLVLLNVLGFEYVYDTPPAVEALAGIAPTSTADTLGVGRSQSAIPGFGLVLLFCAVGVALLRRRA